MEMERPMPEYSVGTWVTVKAVSNKFQNRKRIRGVRWIEERDRWEYDVGLLSTVPAEALER